MTNPFKLLGISDDVVNAVKDLGFENPTPIQEQAIPVLLEGNNDFVGLAQTGTGKTAAFGLPLIELIDFNTNKPQALILCPTRELCLQIASDIKNYSKNTPGASVVAVYGGANIMQQLREIRNGVQIVVATPGRMLDIIGRKAIDFSNVKYVVLDEADEMLNMGFQEDINDILSTTPDDKKTWLFSATMPPEVRKIARNYMDNPTELTMGTKNTGNVNIEHEYYIVRARDKYAALKRIVDFNPEIFAVVFCKTKMDTQDVAENLIKDGYNADALHGDLSQQQRDKVMQRFRDRNMQLLIATDVAARGIDVNNVTHVINYSLPDEIESYTHRSGRTGRAGKTGISICIINSKEIGKIRQIERIIGKSFTKAELPTGFDVCEKQLFSLVHKVHNVEVNDGQIDQYIPRIMDEFAELSKEDVIKRFASLEFNRFLEYYKNAPDLNAAADDRGDRGERGARGARNSDYTRLFINVGSVDEFTRGDLLSFVCNNGKISGKNIGKIDLKGVYSFFEVENASVDTLFSNFKDIQFNNRGVRIEKSGDAAESTSRGGGERRGGFGGGERKSYSGGGERKSYGGGERKSYGGGDRRSSGGSGRREGGSSTGGGGFRDFSGKPREGSGERRRRS
ncbi:DEAD/DEAH box helicase [Pedobacter antarcticus]|uniref:RNA helicase n=2 Tax=Pedobacter antarcticus TaxID=34086 RepID=A0A081PH01_9SPHI|nr:DEAD/DEAH box helicase [Pedobacter antarcticus]KEQ29974.1 DEAD/DEAH box helicase [Pedobacter antarcticus 4BY]SDM04505.1 ATP-dependent RNA helicase DeaD [Pedobacter antarcticus]SFF28258.1 ATP-dependent RNA helicase DeaD [Pedobacter antarcticus]